MISHKYRCIFIHIPKCAGTSIESALGHLENHTGRGGQDHRIYRHIEKPLPIKEVLSSGNNIREAWRRFRNSFKIPENPRNAYTVTKEQFQSYYSFSFVRNPWARAFSWYQNMMADPLHRKNLNIPDNQPFSEFLAKHAGKGYLRPQTYWLKNYSGSIELDFIGRFENLQEDFKKICQDLNIDGVQLPHKLKSKNVDYRDYYHDGLVELVAEVYSEEIEMFGYTFDL